MRTSMLTTSAVFAGLLCGTTASAASPPFAVAPTASWAVPTGAGAAWSLPANVRMVQTSRSDPSGRSYSRIQAAINSVADASAANPYVVRVMPGVYNESVRMKPFVDVVGSGADNTVIRASVSTGSDGCRAATVVMASDSSLSGVRVVNDTPTGIAQSVVGIAFDGIGTARADRVEVWAGSDTLAATRNIGICISGSSAQALLEHVNVEGHGVSADAVRLNGGAGLIVNDSRLAARSATDNANVVGSGGGASTVIINNCTLEGAGRWVNGIPTYAGTTVVTNSRIILSGAEANSLVAVDEVDEDFTPSFTMHGSMVTVSGPSDDLYSGGAVRIATSQLPGDRSALVDAKLVNNYDESFRPIPNQ